MTSKNELKKERGKRAKILRTMIGLSLNEFAKLLNISSRTLISWEGGTISGLSEKGAENISAVAKKLGFQCSPLWLLHGIGQHPLQADQAKNIVPRIYEKEAEEKTHTNIDETIKKEIDFFCSINSNSITHNIEDNSMEPCFYYGDIVGGIRLFKTQIKKAINKDCIIEIDQKDANIICRRLSEGAIDGTYNLSCINPHTNVHPIIMANIKIISAAPVIWIRKS